jgi:predicted metalloendopeptidase
MNVNILDFDSYINGEWFNNINIPDDKSEYSTFTEIVNNNKKKLQQLIIELKSENHIIGNLHTKLYNKKNIDSELSFCELKKYIDSYDNIDDLFENNMYCEFLFDVDVRKTPFSKNNMLVLSPSNIGLPDKSYYHSKKHSDIKNEYMIFIKNIFKNIYQSKNDDEIDCIVNNILRIEDCLSYLRKSNDKMRDVTKIYKKLSKNEFIGLIIDLIESEKTKNRIIRFYSKIFLKLDCNELILMDTNYFHKLSILFDEFDDKIFHDYFKYTLIRAYYPCVIQLEDIFYNFYSEILDNKKSKSDYDDRILEFLEGICGEFLSEIFVKKYFSDSKKSKIELLVNTIINEFRFSIQESTWMDEMTRNNSLKKINNMKFKIGYPDIYPDNTKLEYLIKLFINNNISLFDMIKQINENDFDEKISTINRTDNNWHMLYHHVNAYYTPTKNEVVIPAGILEEPIFKESDNIDDVISNYGMIGMVIAHEISHGFDDQGRKYDHDGIFTESWTKKSEKNYIDIMNSLRIQLSKIKIPIGGKDYDVNLDLTMGENIADLNGLIISYKSLIRNYKLSNKYLKIFFESYAKLWKRKIRDEFLKKKIIIDPHPPTKVRIDMIRNIDKFYELYKLDKSYIIEKDKRVSFF